MAITIQRARSVDEYVKWIKDAMFEVDDLKACLLFDMDEAGARGSFPIWLEPLEKEVKSIHQLMVDGSYTFGREDFLFVELLEFNAHDIPFSTLLKQINATHREGLDVDG